LPFNLPAIAQRQARKRRSNAKALVFRGIEVTGALEAELRAIVVKPVNFWGVAARELIIPTFVEEMTNLRPIRDDATDRLRSVFDATSNEADRLVITLGPAVSDWVIRVERWHRDRWAGSVRRATGFDPEFLIADLTAAPEVKAFQEWASGLIKNVSEGAQQRIESATFRAVTQELPRRVLANDVIKAMKIGRARAALIARDQANKLAGKLDELRHREAGVDRYRWETARDERVRPTHRRNQGKIFEWSKAPRVTGHPRTEINCRCTAQPFIDLLEEVQPSALEAAVVFA